MAGARKTSNGTFYDVLIIGAGISGVNTAYRLHTSLPNHSYLILEDRAALGGTWDLFQYPGIRSDSDLYTFGFPWHPWKKANPIADGESITTYMAEAASRYGIDKQILYRHCVKRASWSSEERLWTLQVDAQGVSKYFTARFIVFGTGYYDFNEPLKTEIPKLESFKGPVIHPQFWPKDLDYTDKKVIVVGSGATAVTLIPNLAAKATKVTMVQRSPTYIVPRSNHVNRSWLNRLLIPGFIYYRWKWLQAIAMAGFFYRYCMRNPAKARAIVLKGMQKELPDNIALDPHFTPRYNPWEQRVCLSPDGDFFQALRSGKADVRTDTIQAVLPEGILLKSGEILEADIIVTATGLKVQMGGNIKIDVDGKGINIPDKFIWRGTMLQDVPNAFLIIGYTNASWTLAADAAAQLICRLIKDLERHRHGAAVPEMETALSTKLVTRPLLDLKATYLDRAKNSMPLAALQAPWQAHDNYFTDMMISKFGNLSRGLRFMTPPAKGKML